MSMVQRTPKPSVLAVCYAKLTEIRYSGRLKMTIGGIYMIRSKEVIGTVSLREKQFKKLHRRCVSRVQYVSSLDLCLRSFDILFLLSPADQDAIQYMCESLVTTDCSCVVPKSSWDVREKIDEHQYYIMYLTFIYLSLKNTLFLYEFIYLSLKIYFIIFLSYFVDILFSTFWAYLKKHNM